MAEDQTNFYETEWGNRYSLKNGVEVERARQLAENVLAINPDSAGLITRLKAHHYERLLGRSVTVTMGNYEDDEAHYTPAGGRDLARLVLTGTE